jgi:large subunit ribosomal protein L33
MAKKGNRVQVIMECTEHKTSGVAGTSRYITTKNKKNTPERLELKKFNSILKKVTVHKKLSNFLVDGYLYRWPVQIIIITSGSR